MMSILTVVTVNQIKDSDNHTRERLLQAATNMLAARGGEGTTMRRLAESVGVKQPVIYYYFGSKQGLLQAAFEQIQQNIRAELAASGTPDSTPALLRARITFHLEHSHLIMGMLNYFLLSKRDEADSMTIPARAYRHIQEVIERGVAEGMYASLSPARDAGIIVHSLNGFAMEHYPEIASHRDPELIEDIAGFIERALRPGVASSMGREAML